jgi:hypothetical protein
MAKVRPRIHVIDRRGQIIAFWMRALIVHEQDDGPKARQEITRNLVRILFLF